MALSMQELKDIADYKQYDKLYRTKKMNQDYRKHCHNLKMDGITKEEYVIEELLGGNKEGFIINEFPYDLEEGINHYVCFYQSDRTLVDYKLKWMDYDFVMMEIPDKKKSVNLPHAHFFVDFSQKMV